MATSSLATKLQIKAGQGVLPLNAPASYLAALEPLPAGAHIEAAGAQNADVVHLFVCDSAELAAHAAPALAAGKNFGAASATHKVILTVPDDVDAAVTGWLAAAYEHA